jgi:hypothetical protein
VPTTRRRARDPTAKFINSPKVPVALNRSTVRSRDESFRRGSDCSPLARATAVPAHIEFIGNRISRRSSGVHCIGQRPTAPPNFAPRCTRTLSPNEGARCPHLRTPDTSARAKNLRWRCAPLDCHALVTVVSSMTTRLHGEAGGPIRVKPALRRTNSEGL